MSKQSDELRDELIAKARHGKITHREAEAQAKAAGLPPLASEPESSTFDPMDESRWTIAMAIAWIAWRDPQLVMKQNAEFRKLCTRWEFSEWDEPVGNGKSIATREGWSLEPWPAATALGLMMLDISLRDTTELPLSTQYTAKEAERELWRELSESRVRSEGFNRNDELVKIPSGEWGHLKLFEEHGRDVFKYEALDRNEPYTKVRFRRDDLIKLWPKPESKSKMEVDCRRWLAGLMRESPQRRIETKTQLRAQALKKFQTISARQFLRAWDLAIEETAATGWKTAGRPPKKSNHRTS